MRSKLLLGFLLFFIGLCSQAVAQTIIPQPHPGPRYIMISTRRLSTLKTELTLTVMQGYHVVAAAPKSGTLFTAGQTVLLEKLPDGAPTPQYWLVDDEGTPLSSRLNDGALAGFRLLPNSAFQRTTHDFWGDLFSSAIWGEKHVNHQKYDKTTNYALMEKIGGPVLPCRYHSTTLNHPRKNQLYAPGLEEGYRIVGDVGAHVIMEKCAAATPGELFSAPESAGSSSSDRFRVLILGDTKKDRKNLNEARSEGFQIMETAGPILILEKSAMSLSPREHKFFTAKNDAALQKQLNSDPGFRLVSVRMVEVEGFWWGSRRLITVMEKPGEAASHYEYLVLSDTSDTGLQDKINEAAKQGYEARALTRIANRLCAILERPPAPASAIKPE